MSVFGTVFFVAVIAAVSLVALPLRCKITTWVGMIGRLISAAMAIFIAWIAGRHACSQAIPSARC